MNLITFPLCQIFHGNNGFNSNPTFNHKYAYENGFQSLYDFFFKTIQSVNIEKKSMAPIAFQLPPVVRRIAKNSDTRDLSSLLCLSKSSNEIFSASKAAQNLPKLKRCSFLLNRIAEEEKPPEIRGISCTLENLEKIERYLQARDKIIMWQVAAQSAQLGGAPCLEGWETLEAFIQIAHEFKDWIDRHPETQAITKLVIKGDDPNNVQVRGDRETYRELSSIPAEIGRFTNLTDLFLPSNQISKIEGLENLTQLSGLNLRNNQISKIEGLEQLDKLSLLILSENKISKVEGLDQLTGLITLVLSHNKISKIEGLNQLPKLSTIHLNNNQISKIEDLDQLPNVRFVILENNRIDPLELDNANINIPIKL